MLLKVNDLIEYKKNKSTFEVLIKEVSETNYKVHLRRCTYSPTFPPVDRFIAFDTFNYFTDKYFQERNYRYISNTNTNWVTPVEKFKKQTWLRVQHTNCYAYYFVENNFCFGANNTEQILLQSFFDKDCDLDNRACLQPGSFTFPEPGFFAIAKIVKKPISNKWCPCC